MQYSGDFKKMINDYNKELKKISSKAKQNPLQEKSKNYALPNIEEKQMIFGQKSNLKGSGNLLVRVFSAKQATPVIDALVAVSFLNGDGEELLKSAFTNNDGEVPTYALPTVNRQESLNPGVNNPYASYRVVVSADGYFTMDSVNVPIFDGETAVLPVEMLPIPEFYSGNTILKAYDTGAIDLN